MVAKPPHIGIRVGGASNGNGTDVPSLDASLNVEPPMPILEEGLARDVSASDTCGPLPSITEKSDVHQPGGMGQQIWSPPELLQATAEQPPASPDVAKDDDADAGRITSVSRTTTDMEVSGSASDAALNHRVDLSEEDEDGGVRLADFLEPMAEHGEQQVVRVAVEASPIDSDDDGAYAASSTHSGKTKKSRFKRNKGMKEKRDKRYALENAEKIEATDPDNYEGTAKRTLLKQKLIVEEMRQKEDTEASASK